jgi:hypothetical protein
MADVLDKLSRDIIKYDPLPVGMYQATVRGLPELKPIGGKQTPAAVFTMTGFVPLQSIDLGTNCGDLATREMPLTFFLTDAALWRLKKFLDDLDIEEGNLTLKARIDRAPNRQCKVSIRQNLTKSDNPTVFAEITQTAKL